MRTSAHARTPGHLRLAMACVVSACYGCMRNGLFQDQFSSWCMPKAAGECPVICNRSLVPADVCFAFDPASCQPNLPVPKLDSLSAPDVH